MAKATAIPPGRQIGLAAILLLLLSAGALGQEFQTQRRLAPQPAGDTVSGSVTSARDGRPLVHAVVTLYDIESDKVFDAVSADDQGGFRFPSVPAGRYRLTGRAKGYIPAAYLEHEGFGSAIVTGAGLNTEGLHLKLNPDASISGHIVDEAGEPIEHASVTLYREFPQADEAQRVRRFRNADTNSDGNYEFIGLAPGTYFLSVAATPWYAVHPIAQPPNVTLPYRSSIDPALDVTYPLTFYPHALSSDEATPLVLHPGEEADGDMQLVPEHALSISLSVSPDPQQHVPLPQLARMVFGAAQNVPLETQFQNGVATLTGIAPGQYLVQQLGSGGLVATSRPVDLSTSSLVLDGLPESPPGTVSVTLRDSQGEAAGPQGQLMLRTVDGDRAVPGKTDKNGTVEFLNVPPGVYRFSFFERGRVRTIAAVLKNGQALPGRRVRLNSGEALALTVSISAAPVKLSGVVQRNGKPVPGAMVVLVPAGDDTSAELFRRDQSDLDGGFSFRDVIPGKYLVVAIEDGWTLRWTDTIVLMPYLLHSAPIEVPANTTSVHLEQPVVPQPR